MSLTDYQYYENNGNNPQDQNWGSYQFISLEDIVNNFMLMYVGDDKIITRTERSTVLFHAKRGIQAFSYNAGRTHKVLELDIDDTSTFVMPPDYVNFVKISLEANGVLYPMIENKQQITANSYLQDTNTELVFDTDGNVVEVQSQLEIARREGLTAQIYMGLGQYNGYSGWCLDGDWYFTFPYGGNFGGQPDLMNINPTFREDKTGGLFYFGSDLVGKKVVLEYISDGLNNGDDANVKLNKLAEEYIYMYICWAILNSKTGIQEYIISRYKKECATAKRNAKISLYNIGEHNLLMVFRNQGKWLK